MFRSVLLDKFSSNQIVIDVMWRNSYCVNTVGKRLNKRAISKYVIV